MARFYLPALLLALFGCDRDAPPAPAEPPAPPAPAAQSAPPKSAHPYSEHTGVLSEADFKKLHELKTDAPPAKRGTMVTVDGTRAYLSLPKNKQAPLPALLVIHEWWGLNQHIMHWTDRLAADGYAALAVDLMGGQVATTPDRAMELMKGVDAAKAEKVLAAAHDFLEKDERIKAGKTGAIGWCFGGKWSLEAAIAEPDLDAAVVYYGHVTTDPARLKKIEAPVLAIFGKQDDGIPEARVQEFEKALKTAGVEHTVLSYDAAHAFANPSGARYDQKAATEAWEKTRAFLGKHLAK